MSDSFREVLLLVFVLLLPFLIEDSLVHVGVLFCNAWVKNSIKVLHISPLDVKRRVASLDLFVDFIDSPIKIFTNVVLFLKSIGDVDILNLSLDVVEVVLEVFLEDDADLLEFLPVVNCIELEGREQNRGVV